MLQHRVFDTPALTCLMSLLLSSCGCAASSGGLANHVATGPLADCARLQKPFSVLFSSLQAVLQHLKARDHASLRHVSQLICKRTTPHVPHVTLLLHDSSSTEQLQQWFQAVRQLQHVSAVHVQVTGDLSADVFGTAMQLLSQQFKSITELHLMAYAGDVTWRVDWGLATQARGYVQSIKGLQHVVSNLQTLVIEGTAVEDMGSDIQQLTAAAVASSGWQLQKLTLNAEWRHPYYTFDAVDESTPYLGSGFANAVMQLPSAFPNLQQLAIRIPPIDTQYETDADEPHIIDAMGDFITSCCQLWKMLVSYMLQQQQQQQ